MALRKALLLAVGAVLLTGTAYAEDTRLHLQKKNAFSLKFGYHWYEDSDVFDFWRFNNRDFDALVTALAYERKIWPWLGIEVSLGYSRSSERNYSGSDLTITNVSVSPTAKYYFPLGDTFVLYAGGGLDYYNTKWDHTVSSPGFTYGWGHDRFDTFGLHGLAGADWYIFKAPEKHGFYSAPVSLFLEFRYTLLEIEEVDDREIRELNADLGQSNPKHDLDLGGLTFFLGLRWHY